MPLLRLDPAPPVDMTLVDWSFKKRFAPPALVSQEARPQPSAETAPRPPTSTALVIATALNKTVGAGVLVLSETTSQAMSAVKPKLTSSSKEELVAFNQAFNRERPAQLFSNVNATAAAVAPPSVSAHVERDADVAEMTPAPTPVKPAFQVTVEISDERDHLGRSFLHYTAATSRPPPAAGRQVVPTRLVHAYKGHTAAVQVLEFLPGTAHLLLSADLGGTVMLWDVLGHKRRVAMYKGHEAGVLSTSFAGDGRRFSTAALDGVVQEWDTETGAVLNSLRYKDEIVKSHSYHPVPRNAHIIIAGAGKRIVQWDTRASPVRVVREYEAHTEAVMHVGFLKDNGHHFASTSEDKTFRTWDIDSSVTVQDFADATMHAVPHFACQPGSGVIAAQSLDNRVNFFTPVKAPGKYRVLKDRFCVGHAVSGSSCRVAFSSNGAFISSGDVNGELHVWDAETCELAKKFKPHTKTLNSHLWHPSGTWLVTSGWDGAIKVFAS